MNDKPWENEPDRVEFKYLGFDCLIVRSDWLGNLCGYVAVSSEHPYYGKHYDDIELEVHGGLTYSNSCEGKICHRTENDDNKFWWFGFDCAHLLDLIPSMYELSQSVGVLFDLNGSVNLDDIKTYKTIGFVKNQIRNMVKQLSGIIK